MGRLLIISCGCLYTFTLIYVYIQHSATCHIFSIRDTAAVYFRWFGPVCLKRKRKAQLNTVGPFFFEKKRPR